MDLSNTSHEFIMLVKCLPLIFKLLGSLDINYIYKQRLFGFLGHFKSESDLETKKFGCHRILLR